jgi:hypothetical protein
MELFCSLRAKHLEASLKVGDAARRGVKMVLSFLPGESSVCVAYDDTYKAEVAGITQVDSGRFVLALRQIETIVLSTSGYPEGSIGIYLDLVRLFPGRLWEELISSLEQERPGNACRALRHVEDQRVFSWSGISVIYSVIRCDSGTIIVFHAVTLYDESENLDFLAKLVLTYKL